MGVLSRFKKGLDNIAGNASKKSASLIEAARINAEISKLQANIEDMQFELGRNYFEANRTEQDGPYADIIQEILNCEQQIKSRNIRLLSQKGLKYCLNCDAIVGIGDEFCNRCGTPMQPKQNTCPTVCENCGALLTEVNSCCPECGLKLK